MRISTAPNATPHSTPPSSRGSRGGADPQEGDERKVWTQLVPLLVHPTKLAIIEGLLEVGKPQSVEDLFLRMPASDTKPEVVEYHAKSMVKLGALEVTAGSGSSKEKPSYFFPDLAERGDRRSDSSAGPDPSSTAGGIDAAADQES